MGEYLDIYSKFLIGNFKFFDEVVDKLLNQPKINKELILKVQRRLKVLKLIDSVSEELEKYFYGDDYKEIFEDNLFGDFEYFVEYLLRCKKRELNINVMGNSNKLLNQICSNSYTNIHKYSCSDKFTININSDEAFLEDYDELDELYFVLDEISNVNINFKILDVVTGEECFEDRIFNRKYKNYVNTKVTILKISDYYQFINRQNIEEFILNRMSLLDPNPIWKYHILNIKVRNCELPRIIINYAEYIKENCDKYSYFNKEFYNFIKCRSLFVLCDSYIETCNEEKFKENFDELEQLKPNLLELYYLKAKNILNNNNLKINKFIDEFKEITSKNKNMEMLHHNANIIFNICFGNLLEQQGEYLEAANKYSECGQLDDYINRLEKTVNTLKNSLSNRAV